MSHVHSVFQSPSVRVTDYRCKASGGAPGPEEASEGWDVVFVRKGIFVRHVRGRRVVGDANHVLFFNRGEPYRVSHPTHGGDDCTVLSVTPAVLRDIAANVDPRAKDRLEPSFAATHAPSTPEADLVHRRLYQALRAEPPEPLAVEEICLALVGHALRVPRHADPRGATRAHHRDLVEHAKELLAARFGESLALADLAGSVGCSPFHLARIFRREAGMPVHQYQVRLRVRTALARIAAGERNLAALAIELGFADQAHFTNTFRRALGFPPSRGRALPSVSALVTASKNLQA